MIEATHSYSLPLLRQSSLQKGNGRRPRVYRRVLGSACTANSRAFEGRYLQAGVTLQVIHLPGRPIFEGDFAVETRWVEGCLKTESEQKEIKLVYGGDLTTVGGDQSAFQRFVEQMEARD